MPSSGWRPEDDDRPSEGLTFGEALAELAVDTTHTVGPAETVRESREDV